jgi:hypothetical protein
MGKWLELFKELTGTAADDTSDTCDTSRKTGVFRVRHSCDTSEHLQMGSTQVSKAVKGVSRPENPGFPTGVTSVPGVIDKATLKSALETPNGSHSQ